MQKQPDETRSEWLARLSRIAFTLTQDQVDACAYVMGNSDCGWTPKTISIELSVSSASVRSCEIVIKD